MHSQYAGTPCPQWVAVPLRVVTAGRLTGPMTTTALDEMGEDELLARAQACADTIRDAETDLLRVAYQWAIRNDPDRLDPGAADRPGRERARHLGGDGTPLVCEFAAAELGARIGRSPHAAAKLMADALDLQHRHPQLWARVEAGQVRASYARHVCAKTRELTKAEARYVDAAVARYADGRISWTRFETLVDAKVAQSAPELAREKETRAAKATFAKKLRTDAHGMGTFMVRADIATIDAIDAIDAAVTTRADTLAESMPEASVDQRRVHAVLLIATGAPDHTPTGDLLPTIQLYLHSYVGPDADSSDRPIARLEGHGPVTEAWITRVLGPHARFKITPVIDLAGQAPVDAYEIPDRHRQAVHLMTPADTFPYASSLSRKMQVDHTIPFDQGGETAIGNYGPMTTRHHRIKTHGRWQVKQPFPGIYLYQDPHGTYYLVDHTGTRKLPRTPGKPTVVELWRSPVILDFGAA